eukprot:NODE_155_length_1930_cov_235.985067.p1 GENE.NODE_155_length_1930_cov_235.985067~~NODE_155_length_1930_cov_235.985067.p1  ORF type:complete len:453 (+),score=85.32 NODE_155_length_1930_cov_235.985067:94-1452(+)
MEWWEAARREQPRNPGTSGEGVSGGSSPTFARGSVASAYAALALAPMADALCAIPRGAEEENEEALELWCEVEVAESELERKGAELAVRRSQTTVAPQAEQIDRQRLAAEVRRLLEQRAAQGGRQQVLEASLAESEQRVAELRIRLAAIGTDASAGAGCLQHGRVPALEEELKARDAELARLQHRELWFERQLQRQDEANVMPLQALSSEIAALKDSALKLAEHRRCGLPGTNTAADALLAATAAWPFSRSAEPITPLRHSATQPLLLPAAALWSTGSQSSARREGAAACLHVPGDSLMSTVSTACPPLTRSMPAVAMGENTASVSAPSAASPVSRASPPGAAGVASADGHRGVCTTDVEARSAVNTPIAAACAAGAGAGPPWPAPHDVERFATLPAPVLRRCIDGSALAQAQAVWQSAPHPALSATAAPRGRHSVESGSATRRPCSRNAGP